MITGKWGKVKTKRQPLKTQGRPKRASHLPARFREDPEVENMEDPISSAEEEMTVAPKRKLKDYDADTEVCRAEAVAGQSTGHASQPQDSRQKVPRVLLLL